MFLTLFPLWGIKVNKGISALRVWGSDTLQKGVPGTAVSPHRWNSEAKSLHAFILICCPLTWLCFGPRAETAVPISRLQFPDLTLPSSLY